MSFAHMPRWILEKLLYPQLVLIVKKPKQERRFGPITNLKFMPSMDQNRLENGFGIGWRTAEKPVQNPLPPKNHFRSNFAAMWGSPYLSAYCSSAKNSASADSTWLMDETRFKRYRETRHLHSYSTYPQISTLNNPRTYLERLKMRLWEVRV